MTLRYRALIDTRPPHDGHAAIVPAGLVVVVEERHGPLFDALPEEWEPVTWTGTSPHNRMVSGAQVKKET